MSLSSQKKTEIDEKFNILKENKDKWATLPISDKINYLELVRDNILQYKQEWVDTVVDIKKMDTEYAGEEWSSGVYPTLRLIRLLINVLKPAAIAQEKGREIEFKAPPSIKEVNGQYVAKVYPDGKYESLMFPGITCEQYIEKGKEPTQGTKLLETMKSGEGLVSLVLGAGNQTSIPFMDAFYKLINENQVVFLKHNPVLEHFAPVIEKIMEPLISAGYFQHTTGAVEEGKYLLSICDNVHITGSDKTHDIIVWGNRDKNKDEPVFTKEITSELGCVTPFIIVPSDNMSDKQLDYLVQHIVGAVVNNNSYNCNAAKLLVTSRNWERREDFLQRISDVLSIIPPRYAYYPGSQNRYDEYLKRYKQCKVLCGSENGQIPWTLIPGISPDDDDYAFKNEPFCPIISEVDIDCESVTEFLTLAVQFCNEKVWGNLSASIFVDDSTMKEYYDEVNEAIDNLKYGGVGVNCWAGLVYALATPIWGAYPGNPPNDIQSGKGFVHNSFLFDYPEKAVVRAPFTLLLSSKYPYFPSNSNVVNIMKAMCDFEGYPSVKNFSKTMWNNLWG